MAELLEKGGQAQVPFLVDSERDVSMYESSDIIDYMREHGRKEDAPKSTKPKIHMSDATHAYHVKVRIPISSVTKHNYVKRNL